MLSLAWHKDCEWQVNIDLFESSKICLSALFLQISVYLICFNSYIKMKICGLQSYMGYCFLAKHSDFLTVFLQSHASCFSPVSSNYAKLC